MLDTPSHIFDCLAKARTLDASIRFHSAAGVYSDLQGSDPETLALFPWLGAHWEEVQGFHRNIGDSSRERLSTRGLDSASRAETRSTSMSDASASA